MYFISLTAIPDLRSVAGVVVIKILELRASLCHKNPMIKDGLCCVNEESE